MKMGLYDADLRRLKPEKEDYLIQDEKEPCLWICVRVDGRCEWIVASVKDWDPENNDSGYQASVNLKSLGDYPTIGLAVARSRVRTLRMKEYQEQARVKARAKAVPLEWVNMADEPPKPEPVKAAAAVEPPAGAPMPDADELICKRVMAAVAELNQSLQEAHERVALRVFLRPLERTAKNAMRYEVMIYKLSHATLTMRVEMANPEEKDWTYVKDPSMQDAAGQGWSAVNVGMEFDKPK